MALIWRALRSCRMTVFAKSSSPRHSHFVSPRLPLSLPLFNLINSTKHMDPGPGVRELSFHAVLAGLLGFRLLYVAFAMVVIYIAWFDTNLNLNMWSEYVERIIPPSKAAAETPLPPQSAESPPVSWHNNLEDIARRDKTRLEESIKNKGL
ncbi:hypothetical protein CASFOL_028749 [Castilleja foliolosa]|uniref:Uncharacterized protein n=1 Tax=Castilleja foliolosa TaxID=1961234 RepID=A0ABD3CED8_9LAMI